VVEVHLFGQLRRAARDPSPFGESIAWVRWQEGDTVGSVLRRLGIDPDAEVSNIFINGRYTYAAIGREVMEGDRLGVFPKNMGLLYV
jgi:molybdopterin converting factor small subunit